MGSPNIFVVFWLDTEDYLTPESDEAALRLARIFSQRGVRATFKVVGEKARVLEERGRREVIEALKEHDIGFHSRFHSRHPLIPQYLAQMGWDEGVEEFVRREGPGLEEVKRILGKAPSCYGQGGGAWAPQAYGAMLRWGIPAYVSGDSLVALGEQPFRFCRCLAISRLDRCMVSIPFEIDSPGVLEELKKTFAQAHRYLSSRGGGLIGVAMHPCTWVLDGEWWDSINFGRGRNPLVEGWKKPRLKPRERIEKGYEHFALFLQFVLQQPQVKVVTAREAVEIYRDRCEGSEVSKRDLEAIASSLSKGITFQKISHGWISAAEGLGMLVEALARYANEGRIPERVKCKPLLGPVRRSLSDEGISKVPFLLLLQGVKEAKAYLDHYGRLPSEFWLGAVKLCPADFCASIAKAFLEIVRGREITEVEIVHGDVLCEEFAKEEYAESAWQWDCFPKGFSAPWLLELTKLQTWSLKPAEPKG